MQLGQGVVAAAVGGRPGSSRLTGDPLGGRLLCAPRKRWQLADRAADCVTQHTHKGRRAPKDCPLPAGGPFGLPWSKFGAP